MSVLADPMPTRTRASRTPTLPATRPASAAAAPPASDVWHGAFAGPADRFIRTTLGPLLLLLATPLFVNFAALAALRHGSSFTALAAAYATPRAALAAAFPLPSLGLAAALALFVAFETALLVALPGRVFAGAIAPSGFVPHFRANGGAAYLCTAAAAAALVASGRLPATALYDNALELLTLLNGAALALAGALAVKGIVAPSTRDAGMEGGLLFSLYWGAELYPSVRGLQLKQLLISRCGMMSWALATASFAAAAVRAHGGITPPLAASVTLNGLYVAKFFLCFEADYLRAADIAVDRFGFMLCWGPLVFMPLAHNLQTLHLVTHAGLPLPWAGAAACGAAPPPSSARPTLMHPASATKTCCSPAAGTRTCATSTTRQIFSCSSCTARPQASTRWPGPTFSTSRRCCLTARAGLTRAARQSTAPPGPRMSAPCPTSSCRGCGEARPLPVA